MKRLAAIILIAATILGCKKESPVPTPDDLSQVGWAVGQFKFSHGTIAKTTDGGKSWVEQTSPADFPGFTFGGVVAIDDNTCIVSGTNNEGLEARLYKTTDGGNSWRQIAADLTLKAPKLGLTSPDGKNIWAAGQDFVIHSGDGGESWTKTELNVKQGYMFVTEQLSTCDGVNIYIGGEVCVSHDTNGIIAVCYSNDAGKNWKLYEFENAAGSVIDISSPDPNTVYMVGNRGFTAKTTDGFKTVTLLTGKIQQTMNDFNGVYAIDANRALVAIDYGSIYSTKDGGENWQRGKGEAINHGCAVMKALLLQDAIHGAAVCVPLSNAEYGQILYTQDGGANWEEPAGGVLGTFWGISFVQVKRK